MEQNFQLTLLSVNSHLLTWPKSPALCSSEHFQSLNWSNNQNRQIASAQASVGHCFRDLEQAWQNGPLVVSIWLQTTQWMVGGEVLCEFMSQSVSRCLLCLASSRVIIHTNGCPDETKLEGRNWSCVSHGALCSPTSAGMTTIHPAKVQWKEKRRERFKVCYEQGSLTSLLEGISRVWLVSFYHSQSFHYAPCSTTTASSGAMPLSLLVSLTASVLQSFLILSSSPLFLSSRSPSALCLHRPLACTVFITALSGPSSFLECL